MSKAFAHTSGDPQARIVFVGEAKEILLTQGLKALVSPEDFERVSQYKWYADVGCWTSYAKTDQLPERPRLHVFIMQPPKGMVVNHKNGNGLICTRTNMEVCTQSVNARKSAPRFNKRGSKYKGVYFHRNNVFVAEITINYKKKYLGSFFLEEDAARAYNKAVLEFLGEGFPLNNV